MAGIVFLMLSLFLVLQYPAVQTAISNMVLEKIEPYINGEVSIGHINLRPFNTLVLKDIVIVDKHPEEDCFFPPQDTLGVISNLSASFRIGGQHKNNSFKVHSVLIDGGEFNLVIGPDKLPNINKVFNLQQKNHYMDTTASVLRINRLGLKNFRFRMFNQTLADKPFHDKPGVIDWGNVDVSVNARGRNFRVEKGFISGIADKIAFSEKSGFNVNNIKGEVLVGQGITMIENLQIVDDYSTLNLEHLAMQYEGPRDFAQFTQKVVIDAAVKNSSVNFKTIEFFAPTLKNTSIKADVSKARVHGTVNNLIVNDFIFKDKSGVSCHASCHLTDTEFADKLAIDGTLKSADFTTKGLSDFLNGLSGKDNVNFGKFAPGQNLHMAADVSGKLNKLAVNGNIGYLDGVLNANINVDNAVAKKDPIAVQGTFCLDDFDLGSLLGIKVLGKCSLNTGLSARLGGNGQSTSAIIDSLRISSLGLLDYNYSGIAAAGKLENSAFDGRIVCNDPNINFLFQGRCNLSNEVRNTLYKFYFNLGYADLNAINLDKRGTSKASFVLNANYMMASKKELLGNIDIKNLVLENAEGPHDIGDICLSSHSNDDIVRGMLKSSFASGSYVGSDAVTMFIDGLKNLTVKKELPVLAKDIVPEWSGDNYKLDLTFHDTRKLLSFVMPGLYIANGTELKIGIDPDGMINGGIQSQRIAYGTSYLKNLMLNVDNDSDDIDLRIKGDELKIGSLSMLNSDISISAQDNNVGIAYRYDNGNVYDDRGEFIILGELSRDGDDNMLVSARNITSSIHYRNNSWIINPADFLISSNGVCVDSLRINKEDSEIIIAGGFSKSVEDTLRLDIKELNLKDIVGLFNNSLDISGIINGSSRLISPQTNGIPLLAGIVIDSTKLSGRDAGHIELACEWDKQRQGFDILALNNVGGEQKLNMKCLFKPDDKSLDASVSLDKFDVGYAGTFLKNLLDEFEGFVNGRINVKGTLDNLSLSSSGCNLEDMFVKLAPTGAGYHINGPFHLNGSEIFIDDINIRDTDTGNAVLGGNFNLDKRHGSTLDLGLRLNNLQAIQLSESGNPSLYGQLKTSGNIKCKGPLSSLFIDASISTSDAGEIHIPLGGSQTSSTTNLLTFKKDEVVWTDPYDEMVKKFQVKEQENRSSLRIKAQANVRDNVDVMLEIDKASGNVITGRGSGNIMVEMQPSKGLFDLDGDYILSSGKYHFTALGITSKDFNIQNGSSIKFSGDIMDSELDINATYIAKANLGNLIADTTAVTSRHNVVCGINISDKLKNPHLDFSVDVPDIDPITKSSVQSALNTDDKIQRQFLSLLLTNNFLPDEQSGIVNNTSLLYSNVSDIMANQLSGILQRLEIPLDLGFNYQPGQGGTNIFDVAVSTQLFNNRVSVNGNIGNRQNRNAGAKSDVVGDLDIEIKLDKPGALRMTVFSHSADQYTNYLDNSQRNGIGITYQKEFNSFRGLWKSIFMKKEERKKLESRQRMDSSAIPKKVISINKDE